LAAEPGKISAKRRGRIKSTNSIRSIKSAGIKLDKLTLVPQKSAAAAAAKKDDVSVSKKNLRMLINDLKP